MRHATFLISVLHLLLRLMPHVSGETKVSEVCLEGECGATKNLIQKGNHLKENIGVGDEDSAAAQNSGAGLVEGRGSLHQKERIDFQKRHITQDNTSNPSVFIGPHRFYCDEHTDNTKCTPLNTECTEEKAGYYCDEYSGNPENRLNDQPPYNWQNEHTKNYYFSIYRSTAICAKRVDGPTRWDSHLKIACRAREDGNWDKKAYWTRTEGGHNSHRDYGDWDPNSEYVTKELFIGSNTDGKESICVEEREGWICDENSGNAGNRLNDQNENWPDTFKIYRSNPVCANKLSDRGRWTMHLNIPCMAGTTGCGSRALKDKEETSNFLQISGKGCQRQGDCISSNNYPQNYGTHDECTFLLLADASVCRLGDYHTEPGGPWFKIKPRSEQFRDRPYLNIDSPIAMPPELKQYDQFEWMVRGSSPRMGWQFCFTPK